MPAIQTTRPDVVLCVPRAIHVPKPTEDEGGSSYDSHVTGDHTSNGNGSHPRSGMLDVAGPSSYRRSASPVKGGRTSAAHDAEGRDSAGGASRAAASDRSETVAAKSSYQYATQATSMAEWNSLLIWARGQRGPQWDSGTGMWQVDQGSNEYYAFANDPARHTNLSSNRRGGSGLQNADGGVGSGAAGDAAPPVDFDRKPFAPGGLGTGFGDGHNGASSSVGGDASSEHGGGAMASMMPSGGYGGNGAMPYNEDSPPVGPGGRRSRAR